jgi:Lon protease-like protein
MSQILEIPLFPLSTVLFPAGRLPLRIFEPRYVAMTRTCLRDSAPFGVVLIRGGFEVGRPAIPYDVGCTARIIERRETAPNRFALLVQGESVFRIQERCVAEEGLLIGRVELQDPPDPTPIPARHAALAAMLKRAVERFSAGSFPRPYRLDDAAWVGNRLAEMLPMAPERKQRLLELRDPLAVLDEIARLLREMGGGEAGSA